MKNTEQNMSSYEKEIAPSYSILHAHNRADGSYKSLKELEMEYVNLVDTLIYDLTHGVPFNTPDGERIVAPPTKVIFLDKSARPVAWLMRELWDTLAIEEEGQEVPDMPDIKYLNIDREQYMDQKQINEYARSMIDARDAVSSKVSDEDLIALRSIFNMKHDGSFETENDLDNERILIVDEVKTSGATLGVAKEIISRAFPSSSVSTTHWMSKQVNKAGYISNADLPVWYNGDKEDIFNELGRGVGNRITDEEILAEEPQRKFLSRRFDTPDERSNRLRDDFKILASRVRNGDVLYIPSNSRDEDTYEPRSERINNMGYVKAFLGRKAIVAADAENKTVVSKQKYTF